MAAIPTALDKRISAPSVKHPKIGLLACDPEIISHDLRPTFSELSNGELTFSAPRGV